LRETYNISKNAIGGNPLNQQATAEFMNNYFSQTDVDQFFHQFWPGRDYNSKVSKVVGDNKASAPTEQASLDIEYVMGMAPNVTTWFYVNTGNDFWSDLTEWVNQLISAESLPWVQSTSYGNEGEGQSATFRDRLSTEFAKLGGRGISVIVSSGDYGTGCSLCYSFEPTFPATSPWVTTVGSTRFLENKIGPEAATQIFSSGGGFSWSFEQPSYQTTMVTKYFNTQKNIPAPHFYNSYGRGIPDVAALGVGYQVIVNGAVSLVYGKGTSTATFSGIITLLNEIRLNNNLKTLGFLNLWLYLVGEQYPDAFYDVTEGNNRYGCCGFTGFSAAAGWDPVTGLGTPNYWILHKIVNDKYHGFRKEDKLH
jgi:tripeptidyl-peptidase-1